MEKWKSAGDRHNREAEQAALFNDLFHQHYKSFCYYAFRYTRDMAIAEDVVEESLVRLWRQLQKKQGVTNLRSWTYTCIRNACIDLLREQKTRERHNANLRAIREGEVQEDPGVAILQAEIITELHRLIHALPPQSSKVMAKLYIEHKPAQQVADELELSLHTVRSHRNRAIRLLRQQWIPALYAFFQLLYK